jgi:hypothetical protein
MFYNKYLVKESDQFMADQFPSIVAELDIMETAMANIPALNNKEMLIAFIRDHSIKLDWMNSNPELYALLISKAIPTVCTEALFDSSANNSVFQKQLEAYIESRFIKSTITY